MSAQDRLRIGLDATCLASGRGYGRFVRELLPPLLLEDDHNEYVLFADEHTGPELESLPAERVLLPTSQPQAEAASARGQRRVGDMWRMGRAAAQASLDIMYFPSVYSFYPVPGQTPVAVAIHDVIPERHGDVVFPTRWNRMLWDTKVLLARRRARALITVSEWSRRSLCEQFGIPENQIYVTLEAPSPIFRPALQPDVRSEWLRSRGLASDARYFLYVGGFNPHKNLNALLAAFASLLGTRPDLQLLLVGDADGDVFHTDVAGLRDRISRLGIAANVQWTGFVEDEVLRHLYSGALALVLPSLEEGFGLPAVEAAACGTGCIATDRSPLPRLLSGAGLFVDPCDASALRAALTRIADDPETRRAHGAAALERVAPLSWSATARATREALAAIASSPIGASKGTP